MSKITYDNKVDLNVDNTIANINKVTASDMNEIKSAVNDNDDNIMALDTPEKWVDVGITAPTDGRRVWFSNSRNILPGSANQWESGHYSTTGVKETYPTRMRLINLLPVKPSTTYYMSNGLRITFYNKRIQKRWNI